MKILEFNPFTISKVQVQFECLTCNISVVSEELLISSPTVNEDTPSHSINHSTTICRTCSKQYEIKVTSGFDGGYIEIPKLFPNYKVNLIATESEELQAILSNTEFYKTFKNEISKIQRLNDAPIENEILMGSLRRLLFTNIITCLESYLSSAFINTVSSKPQNLKRFFETFQDFKSIKISYSQLYELKDKLEDIAKKAMLDVIYHKLDKVSNMYKDVFDIIFPDFSDIARDIVLRHDIVHRNGKTKEGNKIKISKIDIQKMMDRVDAFECNLDEQIHNYGNK